MKQKLIFLDIDGTLLPPGEMLIPQSTVGALHKNRRCSCYTTNDSHSSGNHHYRNNGKRMCKKEKLLVV